MRLGDVYNYELLLFIFRSFYLSEFEFFRKSGEFSFDFGIVNDFDLEWDFELEKGDKFLSLLFSGEFSVSF